MTTLKERIQYLAERQDYNLAIIERSLGFSNGSISSWSTKMPSADKLAQVAKFLNTSSEWLLYGTENNPPSSYTDVLSPIENKLLENFRLLNKGDKIREVERIKTIVEIKNEPKTAKSSTSKQDVKSNIG